MRESGIFQGCFSADLRGPVSSEGGKQLRREEMERFFHKKADEFSENSRSKDRIVISMATAALGFSLAIFSDPDRDLDPDMWLGIGWVAFAVSIVSVLLTYDLLSWLSLRNLDKLVEHLKSDMKEPYEATNPRLKLSKWRPTFVSLLNSLSVYSLILGIVLTTNYVWRNL